MSEYLQLPEGVTRQDDFWADVWVVREDGQLRAQAHIHAPGKGDQIMSLVAETLQQHANDAGEPIIHEFNPANKGAVALVERTPGYTKRVFDNGHSHYERTYIPTDRPQ